MFSLIRLTPPRHAIRRDRLGIIRHPATKVVAAPLVTAGIVAMESAGVSTAPLSPATTSTDAGSSAVRWIRPFVNVTQSTVPALAPTTSIVAPGPTTGTTATTVHIIPTTTGARSAPGRSAAAKPRPATPNAAPGPALPHTARTILLGDYAGSGNPAGIAAFAAATGTHPTLASDYLDRTDGWAGMDGASGPDNWILSQWRSTGYRLVLGVPIIPGGSGATLAQGATGAYNAYFATLAQTLVNGGAGNAILRLGWEFNGNWYPWSVSNDTDAQNFAAYWRQIVTTMRAVPGANFSFLWNPNGGGSSSWNLELAYPGPAYVDYVGTDVYDEYWGSPFTPQASWANAVNQQWGLNWLVSFAAAQGRPIAIPEWSVTVRSDGHGLGDDPYFIAQFANWIAAHDVVFTNIFSYDDTAGGQNDDLTGGLFPNALAAFRTAFG